MAPMPAQGKLRDLLEDEAIELLASVPVGRLIFTLGGLPTVRPQNHIFDDGAVVIRTHDGSATLTSVGSIVAYEADAVDPETQTGWSVIVTGRAVLVEEPDAVARYAALLRPWVDHEKTFVIRIEADMINGFRVSVPDTTEQTRR
jgi:nitroimidazol reductase NimA-like FMN-containing flavoprotein (pyridoxamine 5'-phosphate oxidase superfamily)